MKFLAGRSLKQIGLYCLLLMIVIFVAEYFGVRYHLHSLDDAERKIDFTRSIQISSQQIALQSQLYFQGNTQLASEITTRIEQQDHQLSILADGGRIDGTAFFIKPLSRLPRITFDNLIGSWENYKSSIEGAVIHQNTSDTRMPPDSLGVTAGIEPPTTSKVMQEARWLSLSDWFTKLIRDLEEEVEKKQQAVLLWIISFIALDILLLVFLLYGFNKLVVRPRATFRD